MTQYHGQDPFADPTPRVSKHASADSFRGRLILIEPTQIERNVPKAKGSTAIGDKITANVSVIDGSGPVEIYTQRVKTGTFLEGPTYRGVWFNQDQVCDALQDADGNLLPMVLCRLDTLKPGTMQGQGNPWTVSAGTDADKQTARDFLANRYQAQAAKTVAQTAPAAQANPWNTGQAPAKAPF